MQQLSMPHEIYVKGLTELSEKKKKNSKKVTKIKHSSKLRLLS